MNPAQIAALQEQIHTGIPISKAMGLEITALDDTQITVAAPLTPNLNVHSTGFAGSLYALGILAGWGLTWHLISQRGVPAALVVAEATIRYRAPVQGDIVCRCRIPTEAGGAFVDRLEDRGKASLAVEVSIGETGAAVLTATMVATTTPD